MMITTRTRTLAFVLAATFTMLVAAPNAQAANGTWLTPTAYPSDNTPPFPDWFDSSHWTGGTIANGAGSIATFNNLTGRLNLRITDFSNGAANPGNATTLTLGGLIVTTQRIDSRPYGPVSTIVWDNNGSNVIISHPSAEFLLAHNHVLNDTVQITKSGGQTRFSRLVSGPGGFILSGNQEFVLGESATPNTFAGGVRMLDTGRFDLRQHAAMGGGALTFANTSTTATLTPRNNWSAPFANAIVVETGGAGRIRQEGGGGLDRTFSGAISGGGDLTLQPKDSLWHFTNPSGANGTTGALTVEGDGSPSASAGIAADAAGVFANQSTIDLINGVIFQINADNVFSDDAAVTMDVLSMFDVATDLNEVIGSLSVGGNVIDDGTYDNNESWLQGPGNITIGAVAAVPEPHSIAIWTLIGLALAGFGVYRRRRKN